MPAVLAGFTLIVPRLLSIVTTEPFDSLCDFRGCHVTVMGLGRFGGGIGAVQFFTSRGAAVTVTDLLTAEQLEDALTQIDVAALRNLHLGEHLEEDFREADLIVVSPAVNSNSPFLEIAREECIPLTSEMNLFWQFQRGRVVGVTGSNGKSTTAAMIHSILRAAGRTTRLGGNIGISLLPLVDEIEPDHWTVLELSSFQLDDLDRLPSSPDVAVVTNFTPNHLDSHGSLDNYRKAKQAILRWQTPEGIAVLNADDPDVAEWPVHGVRRTFGTLDRGEPGVFRTGDELVLHCGALRERISLADCVHLPGEHNRDNAAAAACAAASLGVPAEAIRQGLHRFEPLPHRLQFVGEHAGRRFYNDSLATTPESVAAAVASFSEPVVLLAGGYDKRVPLGGLADTIARGTKAAALMGQTAAELLEAVDAAESANPPATQVCRRFEDAFSWACERAVPGDIVLLSPGCASYDWFPNFVARGERFIELVHGLANRDDSNR